jgi:hypothetical protein
MAIEKSVCKYGPAGAGHHGETGKTQTQRREDGSADASAIGAPRNRCASSTFRGDGRGGAGAAAAGHARTAFRGDGCPR